MMIRILLAATFFLISNAAFAHVTANPDNGPAGQYFETKFRISHGCEGSSTASVTITLPKGTVIAKPQHKTGWTVESKISKLPQPVPMGHGKTTDQQIDTITWAGGYLPDDQYDEFGLILKLPETPGEILWFPVLQKCGDGEINWNQIPKEGQMWHDLKSPAPFVKINAAPMEHQH